MNVLQIQHRIIEIPKPASGETKKVEVQVVGDAFAQSPFPTIAAESSVIPKTIAPPPHEHIAHPPGFQYLPTAQKSTEGNIVMQAYALSVAVESEKELPTPPKPYAYEPTGDVVPTMPPRNVYQLVENTAAWAQEFKDAADKRAQPKDPKMLHEL